MSYFVSNYTSLDSNIIKKKRFNLFAEAIISYYNDLNVINKQVRPSRVVGMEMQ